MTTIEIPRLSLDAETYKLPTFISEFTQANYSKTFKILLQGFHHPMWSEEANAAVGTQTVQHFTDALMGFKSQLLENKDYGNQMDYIWQLTKPHEMKPGTFLLYLVPTYTEQYGTRTSRHTSHTCWRLALETYPAMPDLPIYAIQAHWQSTF
jgi:hypothetical protein